MRVVITRPAEDAATLKDKIEALGHEVIVTPLLTIVPRQKVVIPERPWQAIAVTSANGIRGLSGADHLKSIRVLTVGPQSLKAATAAGFAKAEAHGGDVDGLARFIGDMLDPAAGPILYLLGAEKTGDLEAQLSAGGFDCLRVVLYDAAPAKSLGETARALREGLADMVLLYSPRTARIWRTLVEAGGYEAQAARMHTLCLSQNVAAALPQHWRLHVAARSDETAMLALLDQIARTR